VRELRFFLEKMGVFPSTDQIATLMEQLDLNSDGEISWEEFWIWCQQTPTAL